jgi:hypothetical protein
MQPLLANSALKPAPSDIGASVVHMQEMLRLRDSSELFRLETEGDVRDRLRFHNTGPDQLPGLIVMSLSDLVEPDLDPDRELLIVLMNANDEAQTFTIGDLASAYLWLHFVQDVSADPVVTTSSYDVATGTFSVPARTTAVFVWLEPRPAIERLIHEVQQLVDGGSLNQGQGNSLIVKLEGALEKLDRGQPKPAANQLGAFVNEVDSLIDEGVLTPEEGQPLIDAAQSIIDQIAPGITLTGDDPGAEGANTVEGADIADEPAPDPGTDVDNVEGVSDDVADDAQPNVNNGDAGEDAEGSSDGGEENNGSGED